MTIDVHRRRDRKHIGHVRVWLNDVEVTDRCFYADGRRGVVRLFLHDETGHPYVIPGTETIAKEERRGHVRWGRS